MLTHGVDLDHWQRPSTKSGVNLLPGIARPRAVFWGLIDQRMETRFLAHLADVAPELSIVLVGPQQNPDPDLVRMRRIRLVSAMSYDDLPALAAETDVLIMPYADLPVTQAMQPLKLLEYLATGRPVITSDLPAVRPWSDCLDIAKSPGQFGDLVRLRIEQGTPDSQRKARQRLVQESWQSKATAFERLVVTGGIGADGDTTVRSRICR